jgi:hypothetical protein
MATIFLARGSVWYETLTLVASGDTYIAYGAVGANPRILKVDLNGFTATFTNVDFGLIVGVDTDAPPPSIDAAIRQRMRVAASTLAPVAGLPTVIELRDPAPVGPPFPPDVGDQDTLHSSGTTRFLPDIGEIIEEAYERAGLELKSGYDLRTARRSLNLLSIEWSNRGLNLWTISEGFVDLVPGVEEYALPPDTIDLLDVALRLGAAPQQVDYPLTRISHAQYVRISNKKAPGRPYQYCVRRLPESPRVIVWEAPGVAGTLVYWRMRRMQDSSGITYNADLPPRLIPALIAGLAFNLALKRPEAAERIPMLRELYEEQFGMAADEDRDRADLYITPGGYWN